MPFSYQEYIKKQAKKTEDDNYPLQKAIDDFAPKYKVEADNNPPAFNKILEEDRKESPSGTTEFQWSLDHHYATSDDTAVKKSRILTEKQLDDDEIIGKRGTEPNKPIQDAGLKTEQEARAQFAKQNKTGPARPVDKHQGEDQEGIIPNKTIVNNVQRSQLLSNYDDREKFYNKNKSTKQASGIKKIIEGIDAKIYHVFRKAKEENRTIKKAEMDVVKNLELEKIKAFEILKKKL